MASVSSCEKMTLSVKRSGAHRRNIEIEGTGVAICRLPRNLSGVIFFANTGVRFPLFFNKKNHANLAYGSRHTLVGL